MLGPSGPALINVGARFPPCMKLVDTIPPSTLLGCKLFQIMLRSVNLTSIVGMNNTANPATEICTVEDLCGFGGKHSLYACYLLPLG